MQILSWDRVICEFCRAIVEYANFVAIAEYSNFVDGSQYMQILSMDRNICEFCRWIAIHESFVVWLWDNQILSSEHGTFKFCWEVAEYVNFVKRSQIMTIWQTITEYANFAARSRIDVYLLSNMLKIYNLFFYHCFKIINVCAK